MKKTPTLTLISLLILAMSGLFLASCGDDDDGVMERPDYTSINYKLALSADLLRFYNIKATYVTVSGEEKTEVVESESWNKKDKVDGTHHTTFRMNVTATAKRPLPKISSDIEAYKFVCEYSAESYTKATSANREARVTFEKTVKKDNLEVFLEENDTISLVNYKKSN